MKKKVWYEAWALGVSNDLWDTEEFLGEFETKEAAKAHAEKFDCIEQLYDEDVLSELQPDAEMEVVVETVQKHPGGSEAVDRETVAIIHRSNFVEGK